MAKDEDGREAPGFSDEEWAAFERQFTKDATRKAAYKEPSARQRELTAKWKQEAPADTGWRTDGTNVAELSKAARRQAHDDGVSVPAQFGRPRRRIRAPKRIWLRNVLAVVVSVGVTLGIIAAPKLFGSFGDHFGDTRPKAAGSAGPVETSS
jgi:hypothetical protein